MSETRGLKYVSFEEASGYGTAARRTLRGLARSGLPLTWTPMVPGSGWRLGYEPHLDGVLPGVELPEICNRAMAYDTVLVHTVPEYFPLWRAREPGKRLIGYTTWETDRPPEHWPVLLNGLDLLLVPCEWNRQVFRAHGVTAPIEVVPHIVHPGPFLSSQRDDECVFYSIGPWTARKAPWKILETYCRAFAADEPVRLVLKTDREDFTRPVRWRRWFRASAAARRVLRRQPRRPRVEIIAGSLPESAIEALHAGSDGFISLSHGEGWSIPAFDAAAFGNAVVFPRFGGPLDYLGEDTAYLVDCRLSAVEDRRALRSYSRDQSWAVADLDDAARQLRRIFANRAEARRRGAALAASVRRRFSEEAVIGILRSFL